MGVIWKYLFNVLVAVDVFANTVLGGDPHMTVSGRMGKAIAAGRCRLCRPICALLDRLSPGHCADQARYEVSLGKDELGPL